jgi:hypothetical protein
MKCCTKCGLTKPFTEFYRHKGTLDGFNSWCKECNKASAHDSERRAKAENPAAWRAAKRERQNRPARKAHVREYYAQPHVKERENQRRAAWRADPANKDKYEARTILNNALKLGKIHKRPCEECSSTEWVDGHHEDYSRPLEVTWLCRSCHGKRHRLDAVA